MEEISGSSGAGGAGVSDLAFCQADRLRGDGGSAADTPPDRLP